MQDHTEGNVFFCFSANKVELLFKSKTKVELSRENFIFKLMLCYYVKNFPKSLKSYAMHLIARRCQLYFYFFTKKCFLSQCCLSVAKAVSRVIQQLHTYRRFQSTWGADLSTSIIVSFMCLSLFMFD